MESKSVAKYEIRKWRERGGEEPVADALKEYFPECEVSVRHGGGAYLLVPTPLEKEHRKKIEELPRKGYTVILVGYA